MDKILLTFIKKVFTLIIVDNNIEIIVSSGDVLNVRNIDNSIGFLCAVFNRPRNKVESIFMGWMLNECNNKGYEITYEKVEEPIITPIGVPLSNKLSSKEMHKITKGIKFYRPPSLSSIPIWYQQRSVLKMLEQYVKCKNIDHEEDCLQLS